MKKAIYDKLSSEDKRAYFKAIEKYKKAYFGIQSAEEEIYGQYGTINSIKKLPDFFADTRENTTETKEKLKKKQAELFKRIEELKPQVEPAKKELEAIEKNLEEKYSHMINENYDRIDGKLVKNESNYYHYTSTQAFHDIVRSFVNGQGLSGKYYPANTNTYGKLSPKEYRLPNEVCLVRSDRVPDRKVAVIKYDEKGNKKVVHNDSVELSGNIGDIKFTFKEDKIVNKFGKIKPIQEYPVQDKKWIIKYTKLIKEKLWTPAPIAIKSLDTIAARYHQLSLEEIDKLLAKVERFLSEKDKKLIRELKDSVEEYKDGRPGEKMESRIRVPEGKFITLDLIDKIMIPDYLKNDKEVLVDVQKLRSKGFSNISFYYCKTPKDKDEKELRQQQIRLKKS